MTISGCSYFGHRFSASLLASADGFDESFAQMSIQQKNEISHRGLAVKELIAFLKKKI